MKDLTAQEAVHKLCVFIFQPTEKIPEPTEKSQFD